MPITSIGSYEPTTEAFSFNWREADEELAPGTLVLAGNYGRGDFESERIALIAGVESANDAADEARFVASQRNSAKAEVLVRARQFRGAVIGQSRRTATKAAATRSRSCARRT